MNDTPSDHFSAHVGQANFDALVLKQSYSVPVLADFWAAWCGPCKVLMPLLAKIAQDYQGKFFLAKIDTDNEKELATRYAIRSLPTVKIFKQGQVVGEFMGAQPEPAIHALLARHIPRASDVLITQALAAQTQGDVPQALALLNRAVETDPDSDRPKLQLAQLLFESQRYDEGEKILQRLSIAGRSDPQTQGLLARLEFVRLAAGSPAQQELENAIAANSNDHDARYALAARLMVAGDYEPALAHLLEIVRRNRKFRDDAARKAILAAFNILGGQNEMVIKYRKQLSLALN